MITLMIRVREDDQTRWRCGGKDKVPMDPRFVPSCGCLRSSQVDFNIVLAGSLRGAQKKSTVGRLLRGAKDDGEGG